MMAVTACENNNVGSSYMNAWPGVRRQNFHVIWNIDVVGALPCGFLGVRSRAVEKDVDCWCMAGRWKVQALFVSGSALADWLPSPESRIESPFLA